jgi:hypothetical protein
VLIAQTHDVIIARGIENIFVVIISQIYSRYRVVAVVTLTPFSIPVELLLPHTPLGAKKILGKIFAPPGVHKESKKPQCGK